MFPVEEKVLTTHVRGIYCRQCPEWIVDDLLHTRGVLDAAVSFWRAELTVRYDPQIVTEAELRRRLERDIDAGLREPDVLERAAAYLPLYAALRSFKLDTTCLSPEETAEAIESIYNTEWRNIQ